MVYLPDRNHGCRLTTDGVLKGMRTVVLENQKVRVTVLVDKGTDVFAPDILRWLLIAGRARGIYQFLQEIQRF